MILGIMSDIHVHLREQATEVVKLLDSINTGPAPDLLLLAGDISHHTYEIDQFLQEFKIDCPKCWVPGNHDIWVIDKESPDDTPAYRYKVMFPRISRKAGWHYLPESPLFLSNYGIAIIGTMGWFTGQGYSEWFDSDSSDFDEMLAKTFAQELEQSIQQIPQNVPVVVVTHHLSHREIPSYNANRGYIFNLYLEEFLERHKKRILLVVHGHTHEKYGPTTINGFNFVSHPFGYPHQHDVTSDGYRTVEVPVKLK